MLLQDVYLMELAIYLFLFLCPFTYGFYFLSIYLFIRLPIHHCIPSPKYRTMYLSTSLSLSLHTISKYLSFYLLYFPYSIVFFHLIP